MGDHVKAGGIAGWFPEGRMNKGDNVLEVGTFRAGGFLLPTRVDVEIWCVAFVGCADCWPRKDALGGRPSRVGVKISKFCDSSWAAASAEGGGPGLQDEKQASVFFASATHEIIQSAVNELASEMGDGVMKAP